MGRLVGRRSFPGSALLRHRRLSARKEKQMNHIKDLDATMSLLRAVAAGNDVESGQKQEVEKAIETLRRFRRRAHPSRAETYRCVRDVTERLLQAFFKK